MDRFATIKLVNNEVSFDEIGRPKNESTAREVFAEVNSISAAEFFRAGETGLKPEIMFSMWECDYMNEETVIYKGCSYSIYRRYVNNSGRIELYCQKKVSDE